MTFFPVLAYIYRYGKAKNMRPDSVITIDHGTGETLSVAGGEYRILLEGAQTKGSCAIIEMTVPPNALAGPHAHKEIQESFYVKHRPILHAKAHL